MHKCRWIHQQTQWRFYVQDAKYKRGPNGIVSEHADERPLLEMRINSKCPSHVPLLTKRHYQLYAYIESGTLWMDHGCLGENRVVGWIMIHCSTRRWPCEGRLPSRTSVSHHYTARYTQTGSGYIMLWETFSWTYLEPVAVIK